MLRKVSHDVLEQRIRTAWHSAIESYFLVGDELIKARGHFARDREFRDFVEKRLPFSYVTAWRLCKIAQASFLRQVSHAKLLPCDYTTLVELAQLTAEEFAYACEANQISANMCRADAILLRQRRRRLSAPARPAVTCRSQNKSHAGQLSIARKRYFDLCDGLDDEELENELSLCAVRMRSRPDPEEFAGVLEEGEPDEEAQ